MNDFTRHGEARRSCAARVGQIYAAFDEVHAILIGGSVGRGWADLWSDLELCIVWNSLPAEESLRGLAAHCEGTSPKVFPSLQPANGVEEEWFTHDGLKLDLYHRTRDSIEQIIDEVVTCTNPTWDNQVQVELLRSGIGLHGNALLHAWQSRAAYPDCLADLMVKNSLRIGPHAWLEMLAERGDTIYLYSPCCDVERSILGVLLGINRTYPPASNAKWLARVAEVLSIAPDDLPHRLALVFQAEPQRGVGELRSLVDDTIVLVEQHMPDIDTAPIRDRVNQRRPMWQRPERESAE
jgi:hypothetical protein